ncbi:MAG: hypothetical protein ACR2F2_03075 [Pyrinomonadaceae bacterium]
MKFAKYVFCIAGIYGLVALVPQYFLEAKTGADFPPAITHTEYFYGFIGVAIAFQIVFLIIGNDPQKYRAMILPSIVEKFSFLKFPRQAATAVQKTIAKIWELVYFQSVYKVIMRIDSV